MHLKENSPPHHPHQDQQQRPEHPGVSMVRDMESSDSLLQGTLTLLRAMLANDRGPTFEGQVALVTIWSEAVRMAETNQEGATEIIQRALGGVQGNWDMVSGPGTRARIIAMVREDVEKIRRERQDLV